jgi:hypothetical protein
MRSKTPQEALARQQAILRTLATKLAMIADDQTRTIDLESATWSDVWKFAMQAELADQMLDTLAESEGA